MDDSERLRQENETLRAELNRYRDENNYVPRERLNQAAEKLRTTEAQAAEYKRAAEESALAMVGFDQNAQDRDAIKMENTKLKEQIATIQTTHQYDALMQGGLSGDLNITDEDVRATIRAKFEADEGSTDFKAWFSAFSKGASPLVAAFRQGAQVPAPTPTPGQPPEMDAAMRAQLGLPPLDPAATTPPPIPGLTPPAIPPAAPPATPHSPPDPANIGAAPTPPVASTATPPSVSKMSRNDFKAWYNAK